MKTSDFLFLVVFSFSVFSCNSAKIAVNNGERAIERSVQHGAASLVEKRLAEHIFNNLNYPELARTNSIFGQVLVAFAIETDGAISEVKIVDGVHPLLDAEALRVVGSLPSVGADRAARTKCVIPIMFNLTDKFVTI